MGIFASASRYCCFLLRFGNGGGGGGGAAAVSVVVQNKPADIAVNIIL
jgi:hypothetical protein